MTLAEQADKKSWEGKYIQGKKLYSSSVVWQNLILEKAEGKTFQARAISSCQLKAWLIQAKMPSQEFRDSHRHWTKSNDGACSYCTSSEAGASLLHDIGHSHECIMVEVLELARLRSCCMCLHDIQTLGGVVHSKNESGACSFLSICIPQVPSGMTYTIRASKTRQGEGTALIWSA